MHPITAYYRKPGHNKITLANMLQRLRQDEQLSYAAIAAKTGISMATAHHVVSLLSLPVWAQQAVENGTLRYRAARAFADIRGRTDLRELMQPFMDGTVKAISVDNYIRYAKRHTDWSPALLLEAVRTNERAVLARLQEKPKPVVIPAPEPVAMPKPRDVLAAAMKLRGLLMTVEWDNTPDAMLARLTLRQLGITVKETEKVMA